VVERGACGREGEREHVGWHGRHVDGVEHDHGFIGGSGCYLCQLHVAKLSLLMITHLRRYQRKTLIFHGSIKIKKILSLEHL
jgi:hypothetical protein